MSSSLLFKEVFPRFRVFILDERYLKGEHEAIFPKNFILLSKNFIFFKKFS